MLCPSSQMPRRRGACCSTQVPAEIPCQGKASAVGLRVSEAIWLCNQARGDWKSWKTVATLDSRPCLWDPGLLAGFSAAHPCRQAELQGKK